MPYADNHGVRIHYEAEGDGPPLVLAHGATMGIQTWRSAGYVDALRDQHRLVMMDLRGHGASDKPRDASAYAREVLGTDVLAVLDDLGIDRTHYWGYSIGGDIAIGLAVNAPERFASMIIGASTAERDWAESQVNRMLEVLEGEGIAGFASRRSPQGREELLACDADALMACLRSTKGWPPVTRERLANVRIPTLFYAGTEDAVFEHARATSTAIPGSEFVPLEGVTHSASMYRSDLALPIATRFLQAHR